MPTSFTTYYGDILHGAWITWFNDPNGTNGEQLGITFQLNAYGMELTAGFPNDLAYSADAVAYENDINLSVVTVDDSVEDLNVLKSTTNAVFLTKAAATLDDTTLV